MQRKQRIFFLRKFLPENACFLYEENVKRATQLARQRKFSNGPPESSTEKQKVSWKRTRDPYEFSLNTFLTEIVKTSSSEVITVGFSSNDKPNTGNSLVIPPLNQEVMQGFFDYVHIFLFPILHSEGWSYNNIYDLSKCQYWKSYAETIEHISTFLIEYIKPEDTLLILDYEFMLLPGLIAKENMNITIGYNWNVPFCSSELFRCLPQRSTLLESMLSCHLINFIVPTYKRHFFSSCTRILGVDSSADSIQYSNNSTKIICKDMSIDIKNLSAAIVSEEVKIKTQNLAKIFQGKIVIFSVICASQIRGIFHNLSALELFLQKHEEYRSKIAFVQVCEQDITADEVEESKVTDLVSKINSAFSPVEEVTVYYYNQNLDFDEYLSFLTIADCLIDCSESSGFNPIFFEFLICQEQKKAPIIIGEFSALSVTLMGSILVNQWDHASISDKILTAIKLENDEKTTAYSLNTKILEQHLNYLEELIHELELTKQQSEEDKNFVKLSNSKLFSLYEKANKRVLILDYDGTLLPIKKTPKEAKPTPFVIKTLSELCIDPRNIIFIVSGRDKATLENWLGSIKDLGLSAEHGSYTRFPGSEEWTETISVVEDAEWKDTVRSIFQYFTERTIGSFIEEKQKSLVWHYRQSDPDFGSWQAKECQLNLETSILSKYPIEILLGKKNIEVRSSFCNKGTCISNILQSLHNVDFIFCAGDDKTDEDMFRTLQSFMAENSKTEVFTCMIGRSSFSCAKYYSESPEALLKILSRLK